MLSCVAYGCGKMYGQVGRSWHWLVIAVGYTMRDIRYKWNEGPNSVGVSHEVSLPQFKVLGHRQRAMEISLTTGTQPHIDITLYTHNSYILHQTPFNKHQNTHLLHQPTTDYNVFKLQSVALKPTDFCNAKTINYIYTACPLFRHIGNTIINISFDDSFFPINLKIKVKIQKILCSELKSASNEPNFIDIMSSYH